MQVNVIVGAEHAYACIKAPDSSMDVRLSHGCSAQTSLRASAAEMRREAANRIRRAELIERAASLLDLQQQERGANLSSTKQASSVEEVATSGALA